MIQDQGKNPYVADIESITKENSYFRQTLWTGDHLQVTVMNIPVGSEIGLERHEHTEQFIKIESGQAQVVMGQERDNLDFVAEAGDGYSIHIPANTWHNVINSGIEPLQVYSIYSPAEHPFGTVHETKEESDAAEAEHHGM